MEGPHIQSFRVRTSDLPAVTGEMNGDWNFFKSRVVSLIPQGRKTIVNVEMTGNYPYITNQWKRWILL